MYEVWIRLEIDCDLFSYTIYKTNHLVSLKNNLIIIYSLDQLGVMPRGVAHSMILILLFFACQLRFQSCTLIIPLPHYDHFATTFFPGRKATCFGVP